MVKRNGLIIDENGTKRWYKDDKLHRDNDLPAVIYADGTQKWYVDGSYIKSTGSCPIRAQAISMQKDMC